jgi:hypothetical protein
MKPALLFSRRGGLIRSVKYVNNEKPPAVHDYKKHCNLQLCYFMEATSLREKAEKLRVVGCTLRYRQR